MFAAWEAAERPYPWKEEGFPVATVVWEIDMDPKGFAVVQVVGEEAYLANFMIAKNARRRRHGFQFLQKVIMWAASQGARRMLLDVETTNIPAVRLYQKLGFEMIETREKSYPNGESAFVMRKII